MTVKQLIDHLSKFPANAKVLAFDPDTGSYKPITGSNFDLETVELCTDSDESVD